MMISKPFLFGSGFFLFGLYHGQLHLFGFCLPMGCSQQQLLQLKGLYFFFGSDDDGSHHHPVSQIQLRPCKHEVLSPAESYINAFFHFVQVTEHTEVMIKRNFETDFFFHIRNGGEN